MLKQIVSQLEQMCLKLRQKKWRQSDDFEFQAVVCSTRVARNGQRHHRSPKVLKLVLGTVRMPLSPELR